MPSAPALYDERITRLTEWGPHPTPYLYKTDDPALPKELLDLIAEVDALALLELNWDGDYSPPVAPDVIRRARWFLEHLRVPWLPLVGATTVGGVRIEWDAGEAFLIIDFEPSREAQVMFGAPHREIQVWRNEDIPSELEFCYAEVNRARRGR